MHLRSSYEESVILVIGLYYLPWDESCENFRCMFRISESYFVGLASAIGIVGSLIVSGFSPSAEFGILNSSPIGALIVDDIEATEDTEIMARADGYVEPKLKNSR